jgi:hypothetical protein
MVMPWSKYKLVVVECVERTVEIYSPEETEGEAEADALIIYKDHRDWWVEHSSTERVVSYTARCEPVNRKQD